MAERADTFDAFSALHEDLSQAHHGLSDQQSLDTQRSATIARGLLIEAEHRGMPAPDSWRVLDDEWGGIGLLWRGYELRFRPYGATRENVQNAISGLTAYLSRVLDSQNA
jgi:hypothetical protein